MESARLVALDMVSQDNENNSSDEDTEELVTSPRALAEDLNPGLPARSPPA